MMYKDIISHLDEYDRALVGKRKCHLGIFSEPYLTLMLEGKKTIESRFSLKRQAPYKQISKDDIVFIKKSSGPILGYLILKEVLFFDLRETPIAQIREKYGKELCVSKAFYEAKEKSNYATLLIIDHIKLCEAFKINKKGMQTWIVLN